MAGRRELIEGLKTIDPNIDVDLAEEFIANDKPRQAPKATPAATVRRTTAPETEKPPAQPALPAAVVAAAQVPTSSPLTGVGRVPVGARVRTELASALKRASLERQLQGIQPNSVQDILEDAIELWLHKHGLLK